MRTLSILGVLATMSAAAGPAFAGPLDPPAGPIAPTHKTLTDIEPRIAISDVNTPGDADSVFRITQPGSYYLTGNLIGQAGKHGIEINAVGVTIDLSGFHVVGVASALCGIRAQSSSLAAIEIHSGSVRNWEQLGIDLGDLGNRGSIVRNVRCSNNIEGGFVCPDGSLVLNCTANDNGGRGIDTGFGTSVVGCCVYNNGERGIAVGTGCTVSGCISYSNDAEGIVAGGGCHIANNLVRNNGLDGIRCGSGCAVLFNVCTSNGQDAVGGAGIHTSGSDTRIEGNNCISQDRGIDIDGAGNFIVRNTCSGNAINWEIVANNVFGPIIDRTSPGSAAVSGNAAPSSLGSTDANANYSY